MTTAFAAATLGQSVGSMGDAQSAQAQAALKIKAKAKSASQQFEAMFLNSMFQQMFTKVDGDGPFGGSGPLKVWRSFLTDEYAKTFAKNGGLGIASHVYEQLLKQQGVKSS
jgi:peptidoglycan hydrolase FlgJ